MAFRPRCCATSSPPKEQQPRCKGRSRGESLLCRGSSFFLPSFLPSCHFLTMYFPLLVSRANNGRRRKDEARREKKEIKTREEGKRERKNRDGAYPPTDPSAFSPPRSIYVCKAIWDGMGEEREESKRAGSAIEGSIEERERRQQGRINWR